MSPGFNFTHTLSQPAGWGAGGRWGDLPPTRLLSLRNSLQGLLLWQTKIETCRMAAHPDPTTDVYVHTYIPFQSPWDPSTIGISLPHWGWTLSRDTVSTGLQETQSNIQSFAWCEMPKPQPSVTNRSKEWWVSEHHATQPNLQTVKSYTLKAQFKQASPEPWH